MKQYTLRAIIRHFWLFLFGIVLLMPTSYAPVAQSDPPSPVDTRPPIPIRDDQTFIVNSDRVTVYPGPVHYAGDVLTIEVTYSTMADIDTASVRIGNEAPQTIVPQNMGQTLILPDIWDTQNAVGTHVLRVTLGSETFEIPIDIQPANTRPAQEVNAEWVARETDCCVLHYLTETAAARDIEAIITHVNRAYSEFLDMTATVLDEPVQIYFLDRMWGNGAFGGDGELVLTYIDRDYGPRVDLEGLVTLLRHEFTHAVGYDIVEGQRILYNEGLAVYVAGGHYKPEPLAQRGAAMVELGYFSSVGDSSFGHETGYLKGAVLVTYLVETYGIETTLDFLGAASEDLPAAVQDILDISAHQLNADLLTWLQAHDPGEQVRDLALTIELQDLRRRYQETMARPPMAIFGRAEETFYGDPDRIPLVMRSSTSPENVALELLIASGQRAIRAGDYDRAETLVMTIRAVLDFGTFDNPLAADYFAISNTAHDAGYEVLELNLEGSTAQALVTDEPPIQLPMTFVREPSGWVMQP